MQWDANFRQCRQRPLMLFIKTRGFNFHLFASGRILLRFALKYSGHDVYALFERSGHKNTFEQTGTAMLLPGLLYA